MLGTYCKRANIRGGFNFAMFAVDNFVAKLKPPLSVYNTSFYSYLFATCISENSISATLKQPRKVPIKKTAKF